MSLTIFACYPLLTLLALLMLGILIVRNGGFVVRFGFSEALFVNFYNTIGQKLYVI